MSDMTDREKILLWLNDRLGHRIQAQVLIASPSREGLFAPLLQAEGCLKYSEPEEIQDAPFPLEGVYGIGDEAILRLNDLLERVENVMGKGSELGAWLAPDTNLMLKDLTYQATALRKD